jgi:DNA helicase-2/ATP-dependent DNA helicase PcrA
MDLLADLNEPQREAVQYMDGPLLVLAGAGSGKTRVITRRVAWLVQQGVAPWNVLAITFTNKAAEEMRQRVESLGTPRGTTVATFHALCARLLREFSVEAGLQPNYTIYDRDDQVKVVKDALQRLDLPTDRLPPGRVHSAISRAKNDMKMPEEFAREAESYYTKNVARVYAEYDRLLKTQNAMDFDDLLLRMTFLLRDRPEIRELLGRRYLYIMIDEYQDTNRAQYLLAHGIAMGHENICATGDPDQSIYAWRGADIGNILEFEEDYPSAKVIRLEENYRSTQPILDAASTLIAHNVMRKPKKLWTRREGGAKVKLLYCEDEHSEASEVAKRIAAFIGAGGAHRDVAVFYRMNALSRLIEEAMVKGGIPYRIARGTAFYGRKEIKDVLAYLKLMVNPADDLSCLRVINTPARGIGGVTVKRLGDFAIQQGVPFLEACRRAVEAGLSEAAAKKAAAFAELIRSLASSLAGSVKDAIEEVLRRSGLEKELGSDKEETLQAKANVDELISSAAEFEGENGGTLADYLQRVSLVSDADHFEGGSGAVTLMTLHAAKGLEFPVVFVVGCEEGILPFQRAGAEEEPRTNRDNQVEEERRLAFVGMTRAENELTLSCAEQRMIRGMRSSQTPSKFLGEIGSGNVVVERLGSPRPVRPTSFSKGGFYAGDRLGGWGRHSTPPAGDYVADSEERALIEAMEDQHAMPPEYEHLKVGSKIHHPQFGIGRVLKLSQPWPETRAEIMFEDWGVKKIVVRMARLEIL